MLDFYYAITCNKIYMSNFIILIIHMIIIKDFLNDQNADI